MLQQLSETDTLKRFISPPGDPPKGSISVFPSSPLDLPAETFQKALERREKNHQALIQWIRKNLNPDIDYGRSHIFENCKYVRAGAPFLCSDFSHFSMLTLWKSGAEKIARLLGLTAHFPTVQQYEIAGLHHQEIQTVVLKCELRTQAGTTVGEGTGARHLKQDGWNLNISIKMACKSAMVDAVIRTAGLTGIFIKTHRHTLKNNMPDMGNCNYNLTSKTTCNTVFPEDKPITPKQKDLIQRIAGRRGLTTEGLNKAVQRLFDKDLDSLDRVQASRFIQHLNG
ncbi:MAG: hypothetical protein NDI81_13510 [Desulfobacula sp.]|nr:hypothetical protein [Desulfobacula sp.]